MSDASQPEENLDSTRGRGPTVIDRDQMSLEIGRMQALAQAAFSRAEGEASEGAMWLIDLLVVDLKHLKDRIDTAHYDCCGQE